jgi:hypothetical protein
MKFIEKFINELLHNSQGTVMGLSKIYSFKFISKYGFHHNFTKYAFILVRLYVYLITGMKSRNFLLTKLYFFTCLSLKKSASF